MNTSEIIPAVSEANTINIDVELQNPCDYTTVPAVDDLEKWCAAALQSDLIKDKNIGETEKLSAEPCPELCPDFSIVVRVVDEEEGTELNQTYRQKAAPTNILSFPYEFPEELLAIPEIQNQQTHLGDLVVCESVVKREAEEQGKTLLQHWAHLIVHGVLHLQGCDHVEDSEAEEMEALEVVVLKQLGFNNPYK